MLTIKALRAKALRRWNRGQILQAWLGVEAIFPLRFPLGKPTAAALLEDYSAVREWKAAWEKPGALGPAGRLEYGEINHRQLGRQRLPAAVIFDTVEGLAAFIGEQRALQQFADIVAVIHSRAPELAGWLQRYPMKALQAADDWPKLLAVLDYFKAHPHPGCYLRELDIPAVDTKFIERHKGLLTELLNTVLPADAVVAEVTGLARSGFERRFGLQYDEPLIRFRLLDAALTRGFGGLDDLTVPLSRFARLQAEWDRVFITENKINGLSFPPQPRSIVVFGLGYGISSLQEVGWLQGKEICYWGDIDSHGFAILSQLRSDFGQVRSFLMDIETLERFRALWVREDLAKRCTAELPGLHPAEAVVYERLRADYYGAAIRLEQERIAFDWVLAHLPVLF